MSFIPKALRLPIAAAVTTGLLLLITQVAMNTPGAIVYRGVALGMVSALTAAGIILIYRTLRVINFAQAALGTAGGILTFAFVQYTRLPFLLAFAIGLLLSGLVGFAIGVLALRFSKAPRLVLTVLTIVVSQLLAQASPFVLDLRIFPQQETLNVLEQLGQGGFKNRLPLAGLQYQIGDLPVPFGFSEILAIEVGIIALLAVGAFFRYTRAGVAVRAMAENSERASLLGIGVGLLSCIVWAIAGVLSGAGVTMTGILTSPQIAQSGGIVVLLPALTAAVIGRMRNLPITVIAAVAISVLKEAWTWNLREDQALFDVLLFVAVAAGLILQRRVLVRSEQQTETSSWVASQEPRPTPRELMAVPGVRIAKIAMIVIGLVALGLYPFVVGTGATALGAVIAIQAIVVLSLVVLTGWAGQVSLGQFGLVAVGSVIGGALSAKVGLPFYLSIPLATIFVAAFAALIGLPALRIPGLFLLVVTFAFAVAVRSALFEERYFGWLLPESVDRPAFLFLDFEDERSMYFLCVTALVLSILVVRSFRRTRTGRVLIALRENESGVRSFGVAAVRTKLLAFAIAGGLCGFAGAILIHQQRGLSADSFLVDSSISAFTDAIFGGVSAVSGALLGAAYFRFTSYFSDSVVITILAGPMVTLAILFASPGGLISILMKTRDAILKIVAQRRQLIVPSLFADVDPDVLERRQWPLGEPLPSAGLAALPPGTSYSLTSHLYSEDRHLVQIETNGKKATAPATQGTKSFVEGEQSYVETGEAQ